MRFSSDATRLARVGGWRRLRPPAGTLAALVTLAVLLATALPVAAQQGSVAFEISVVRVSPEAGGVESDARARRFDRLLGKRLRYETLEVMSTERREVGLQQTSQVDLPTGKRLRFRPLDRGDQGVLVAVDLDGTAQGDFRIPKGKPLLLGGQPYQSGQLFVALEVVD